MAPAYAVEPLDNVLGPATALPPAAERIVLKKPPALPEKLSPEFFATNPAAVVAFVEAKPERLNPQLMKPPLVLTLSRVLLSHDRAFLAEKLLGDAAKLWPNATEIGLSHARVLRRLGQPSAALRRLRVILEGAPDNAQAHYLLAASLLEVDNTSAQNLQGARAALVRTLALDPNYKDPEGDDVTAVRYQLEQINKRLAAQ